MTKKSRAIFSLICWYIPVALVQFISAKVTMSSLHPWYASLKKAPWTPPAWVFGPTWTVLYVLMAVSIWLIYPAPTQKEKRPLLCTLFFVQLALNGLWSFLFFGLHLPGWALINLSLLVLVIAYMSRIFFPAHRWAGVLLWPYLLWSAYALSLNFAIWWLN